MRLALLLLASSFALPVTASARSEVVYEQVSADSLAQKRRVQIDRLRTYALAGVFPLNTTRPGLLSQLLDGEKRPCAMAHLLTLDGLGHEVARLAKEDNAIELASITEGPVHEWILNSGLTREEVAYIQEPDFFMEEPDFATLEQQRLQSHFLMAAHQLDTNFDASIELALTRLHT